MTVLSSNVSSFHFASGGFSTILFIGGTLTNFAMPCETQTAAQSAVTLRRSPRWAHFQSTRNSTSIVVGDNAPLHDLKRV